MSRGRAKRAEAMSRTRVQKALWAAEHSFPRASDVTVTNFDGELIRVEPPRTPRTLDPETGKVPRKRRRR